MSAHVQQMNRRTFLPSLASALPLEVLAGSGRRRQAGSGGEAAVLTLDVNQNAPERRLRAWQASQKEGWLPSFCPPLPVGPQTGE